MRDTKSLIATMALATGLATMSAPAAAGVGDPPTPAARCEALAGLDLPDTTIASAAIVAGKASHHGLLGASRGHPEFCRVVARVRAAPDSDVGVEVWLPLDNWAGVFHGNGNGGFGGTLAAGYAGMAEGLRRGFAAATTDTGTAPATSAQGDALIGHPRKWRDWARLSTHVMTVTGKAITQAFYGQEIGRAYYTGCSTGGQQGLIEALHYPADYDAILVGAPVIDRIQGHAAVLWDHLAAYRKATSLLSDTKLKLLNRAAIAACWQQGASIAGDLFVSDPLACKFDPVVLLCADDGADACLTADEVATARAFYSGPTDKRGRPAYHGWLPGSEAPGLFGWNFLQAPIDSAAPFASLFKWVFGPDWDWRQFDFDRDMPRVKARLDTIVNDATRGDLRDFAARGGKLIIYHGLADALVPPGQSVSFHARQQTLSGAGFADSVRLYLVPGMMHCGGGAGPDSINSALAIPPPPPADDRQHDLFSALIAWVAESAAPGRLIATKFSEDDPNLIEFQRPLCPYPQKAIYRGVGSTKAAASFDCQ